MKKLLSTVRKTSLILFSDLIPDVTHKCLAHCKHSNICWINRSVNAIQFCTWFIRWARCKKMFHGLSLVSPDRVCALLKNKDLFMVIITCQLEPPILRPLHKTQSQNLKEASMSLQMTWAYKQKILDSTKRLLELINKSGKFAGYKINTQKAVAFLY